jgi:hypothetical protein
MIKCFFIILLTLVSLRVQAEEIQSPAIEEASTCADLTVCNGNYVPDMQNCYCVCGITECKEPTEVFDPTTCTCQKEAESLQTHE